MGWGSSSLAAQACDITEHPARRLHLNCSGPSTLQEALQTPRADPLPCKTEAVTQAKEGSIVKAGDGGPKGIGARSAGGHGEDRFEIR